MKAKFMPAYFEEMGFNDDFLELVGQVIDVEYDDEPITDGPFAGMKRYRIINPTILNNGVIVKYTWIPDCDLEFIGD